MEQISNIPEKISITQTSINSSSTTSQIPVTNTQENEGDININTDFKKKVNEMKDWKFVNNK